MTRREGQVRIERVEAPGAEWDAFAERQPRACLGHAAAWSSILADAYGIEPAYLAARDGAGGLRGVLPLARLRSLRGARVLVSLPFLDAAGVLADDPQAGRALLDAARELGAALELRQHDELPGLAVGDCGRVDLFLPLGGGAEARWHALPAKVRNQTRKARKAGLGLAAPSADPVPAFHRLHMENMRELGSPPHAEGFFRAVARHFGDRQRVVLAVDRARPVGGLVAIHYAGAVAVPWASTLPRERARCPNNVTYWEALRWAEDLGAREFAFGRSPPRSGSHRFKRGWGALERPLHWVRFDGRGRARAATSAGDSIALRALSQVWRRLPPALCERYGPALRRRIAS